MTSDLRQGDCFAELKKMDSQSVQTCVTSPPYFGLRDYGVEGQFGLEATPDAYVAKMVEVFAEVRRVLRDDGTLWLNLGDSYCTSPRGNKAPGGGNLTNSNIDSPVEDARFHGAKSIDKRQLPGLKNKDLIGIPWRVAFALQADSWYLRQDIIWAKPNPMPESVRDRCTKSHEYIFLMSKKPKYYYDHEAIKEDAVWRRKNNPAWNKARATTNTDKGCNNRNAKSGGFAGWDPKMGRNKRSVWTVNTRPFKGAHFAVFPPALIEPCILAGAPKGGVVLDPFMGSGTTGMVAKQHGRNFIGIELNPEYLELARQRMA